MKKIQRRFTKMIPDLKLVGDHTVRLAKLKLWSFKVSEQFLNGTSAHNRPFQRTKNQSRFDRDIQNGSWFVTDEIRNLL